jgi:iron complex outermembrane receptor protein
LLHPHFNFLKLKKMRTFSLVFFMLWAFQAQAQICKGIVYDAQTLLPIEGVAVVIGRSGTITDKNGRFELEVKSPQILQFRFVGYQSQQRSVSAGDSLVVALEQATTYLAELSVEFEKVVYPVAVSDLKIKDLARNNLGQDLPFLLNQTPSALVSSDAGAGIGYTNLRIRGSDGTRTNVTLNGIPVNDSESHGVFWVNMPDLATSATAITIQRGAGTSVNGAGAFGATLNIETDNHLYPKPVGEYALSYGSFNTWRHSLSFNSGKISEKLSLYARLSKVKTDGYIDNAWADLKSMFISLQYQTKIGTFTANIISGKETTFQAWNGVSEENISAGRRTFNELARYENETDNYQQDHYHLLHKFKTGRWNLNSALHYTHGRGYFEQYAENQNFVDYGLQNLYAMGDSITSTDLIRRRWLSNDFVGLVAQARYTSHSGQNNSPKLEWIIGSAANRYLGRHFGEVIWAKFASNGSIRHRYYDSDATKTDLNFYSKLTHQVLPRYFVFLDLQYRYVSYEFTGKVTDASGAVQDAPASQNLSFFNPKAGISYRHTKGEVYASVAVAQREPNRDDFTNNTAASRPKAERLTDYELGFNHSFGSWAVAVSGFYMDYRDQLVLNGKINDVGAYTRQNIARSFRRGIEIQSKVKPTKNLLWQANLSLSQNKIINFEEYVDDFDQGGQIKNLYKLSDIALSPAAIAGSEFSYRPASFLEITWLSKYVGKQFLDNTSSELRKIDAFWVQDLRINSDVKVKGIRKFQLNFLLNNFLDVFYAPSGYTFGWIEAGKRKNYNYFYPQAGRNFLVGLVIGF